MNNAGELFTDGEAYEQMMGRWSRFVGAIFLDWLNIPSGLRWLDVGCGNGAFTEEIIARCAPASVIGVDPAERQLAYARSRPGAKAAEFRSGSAQHLPFGDDSFDAAVMALVIAFLTDPLEAAREMTRVVRPGGWVATYMWDVPGGGVPTNPIYKAIDALGLPSSRPPNPEASGHEAMRTLWQQADLEAVDTRVIRIPVVYSSFDEFWNSNSVPVGPQGKLIAGMPADMKEKLRAHLRAKLPAAADGRIVYDAFANAVQGRVAR